QANCAAAERHQQDRQTGAARAVLGRTSGNTGLRRPPRENIMPLKTPEQYIESLRDGRVTFWDGERIDDITTHPRFKVPIAMTAKDYDYNDPEYQGMRRYKAED